MVIQIPIGKIILLLFILAISIFVFFFWLRRRKKQEKKKQLERLRTDFENSEVDIEEASKENTQLFEEVIENIEEAFRRGEEKVKLELNEDTDIKIETPEIIALQTPSCELYKSFSRVRLQSLEKTNKGIELHLKTD